MCNDNGNDNDNNTKNVVIVIRSAVTPLELGHGCPGCKSRMVSISGFETQ